MIYVCVLGDRTLTCGKLLSIGGAFHKGYSMDNAV